MPREVSPPPARSHAAGPLTRRADELSTRPDWARAILLLRLESGMTLRALSDATGIDLTVLSRYENGRRRPRPFNERRILHVLAGA